MTWFFFANVGLLRSFSVNVIRTILGIEFGDFLLTIDVGLIESVRQPTAEIVATIAEFTFAATDIQGLIHNLDALFTRCVFD